MFVLFLTFSAGAFTIGLLAPDFLVRFVSGGCVLECADTEPGVSEESVERWDGSGKGELEVDGADEGMEKRGGLALPRLIGESGLVCTELVRGLVDLTGLGVRRNVGGVICCCGMKEDAGRGLGGPGAGVGNGLDLVGEDD